jgi:hypothetical protein
MKLALLLSLVGFASAGVIQVDLDQEWTDFKQLYAKTYRHDTEEVFFNYFLTASNLKFSLLQIIWSFFPVPIIIICRVHFTTCIGLSTHYFCNP